MRDNTITAKTIESIPANCHAFGVFFLIFGLTSGFATLSLIVTHFADLPLIFTEMPLILMIFARHFHSYRLSGCEFLAHPEYLGFQITYFENFWLGSL